MPVKIRLQRRGRKKKPFYYIVIADSRAPRDGKFIQKVGTYNPLTSPATIDLDREEALQWLQKGAQPTDTVRRILSYKGVLYLKHLKRGVKLGLFDEQTVTEKFEKWLNDHEGKLIKGKEQKEEAKKKEQEEAERKKKEAIKKREEEEKAKEEAAKEEAAKEDGPEKEDTTEEKKEEKEAEEKKEDPSKES